jgi:hypothetical protein
MNKSIHWLLLVLVLVDAAPLAVLGLFALLFALGCTPANAPTQAEIDGYAKGQMMCVALYPTTQTIDACRAQKIAAWCARFPGQVECVGDAGGGG